MKIIIDTREQKPWEFGKDVETVKECLETGDYSIEGHEADVCLERKELSDFIACCSFERTRFKACMERMMEFKARCVVIEGDFREIALHHYQSQIEPQAVIGSIASWTQRYNLPFILASDRVSAARFALAFMRNYLKQLEEVKA
ncbi:MAG: ERCC4 domain-containing protein [Victivallales bacterium]